MKLSGRFVTASLSVSSLFAVASVWIASSFPDGLDSVAERLGFAGKAGAPVLKTPMPDYSAPLLGESPLSGVVAAIAGVALAFAAGWTLARALRGHRHPARLRR
jgi:hypothetical protein